MGLLCVQQAHGLVQKHSPYQTGADFEDCAAAPSFPFCAYLSFLLSFQFHPSRLPPFTQSPTLLLWPQLRE